MPPGETQENHAESATAPDEEARAVTGAESSLQRMVRRCGKFIWRGKVESGVSDSEVEEINSLCRYGNGDFEIVKTYPNIKVLVRRKRSLLVCLLRNDICRLICKRLFMVPLANLLNAKNNPAVRWSIIALIVLFVGCYLSDFIVVHTGGLI